MPKASRKLTVVICLIVGLVGASSAQVLVDKVNGGESRASLQQSFVTLNKRIAAAAKNEQKGLKLLGLA